MNPNYLDFEQPIADLEVKIEELRSVGHDNDLNIGDEITKLSEKSAKLTQKIYSSLTPWDIVRVARHPQRPYTKDYIERVFEEFDELHGDRQFADDAAIIGGLARLQGEPVMVIGQEKGRSVSDKVSRNFGMPRPEGYRKALRLMEMAERFFCTGDYFNRHTGSLPGYRLRRARYFTCDCQKPRGYVGIKNTYYLSCYR